MSSTIISGITLGAAQRLAVLSGPTADRIVVDSGGSLTAESGGAASGTTMSGGYATISPGGTASDTTIDDGSLGQRAHDVSGARHRQVARSGADFGDGGISEVCLRPHRM